MTHPISPISTSAIYATNDELKKVKQEQEEELLFSKQNETKLTAAEETSEENQEITFKEGLNLFGQGAWNKVKEMGSAIIKHPGKTLLAVGATTAALAALPLIGISSATGAAALAVGFGAYSIFNTGKDIKEAVEDYNEGKFDEVREDIQELGGDGVDLAMSIPFMPKALKQIGRTAKYGTSTIGLNTSLISSLKNVSSLDDVLVAFGQANTKINYEIIGNELGYTVKPQLEFTDDAAALNGVYDEITGKITMNNSLFKSKSLIQKIINTIKHNGDEVVLKSNPETILRHELVHFQQASDIVQNYGTQTLIDTKSATIKNEISKLDENITSSRTKLYETLLEGGYTPELAKNCTDIYFGENSAFNTSFYDDVIKNNANNATKAQAQTWIDGNLNKGSELANAGNNFKNGLEQKKVYATTTLEKPAYAAQYEYYDSNCAMRSDLTTSNLIGANIAQETFSEDDVSLKDAWWGAFVGPYLWQKFKNTGEKSLTVSEVFKIAVEDKGTPWSIVGKLRELFE